MSPSPLEEKLDLQGEKGPYPLIYTFLKLREIPPGALLRVITDQEYVAKELPKQLREQGFLIIQEEGFAIGRWEILVKKPEAFSGGDRECPSG